MIDDRFVTNAEGDITHEVLEGRQVELDPKSLGWLRPGGANDPGERRRSVPSLGTLPGFSVSGPTPIEVDGLVGAKGTAGAVPPASVESKGGTLAHFDRLTEAAGYVDLVLTPRTEVDEMYVYDNVAGSMHTVEFVPQLATDGKGIVYIVDDGVAIKVGYTGGTVASRIGGLQTGNPRQIMPMAEIRNVGVEVEATIQKVLESIHVRGEWYARDAVIDQIVAAGSVAAWVDSLFDRPAGCQVVVHKPFG